MDPAFAIVPAPATNLTVVDKSTAETDLARRLGCEVRQLWLLPRAEYIKLRSLARHLPRLQAARSLRAECQAVAQLVEGLHWRVIYRRVSAWRASNDWRELVDRRSCAELWENGGDVIAETTREWWRSIYEAHKRSGVSAYRQTLSIWRLHHDWTGKDVEAIPGYSRWPEPDQRVHGKHPRGWSYASFIRACERKSYGTAAAREGLFAASEYRVPLLTTRVGLKLGERVEFDDHEFDVKIHLAGLKTAFRPLCFGGVDGLSTCFDFLLVPTRWDLEADRRKKLTEQQFRYFVLHWLCKHGYRTDERGTTFFVERGTAAIREEFEQRLYEELGGKVKVARGAMFAASAHAGQFRPRGKGNFRFKPLIEGFWNLLENRLDHLPGQQGSNSRLNGPAELHGRTEYLERLLDWAEGQPDEIVAAAKLPFLTYREFSQALLETSLAIVQDREHDCEGWEQLGFIRKEFRTDGASALWHPEERFMALGELDRKLLAPLLADPARQLTRTVKFSRAEVWGLFHKELTRITPHQFCRLLDERDAVEVTVGKNGLIEFEDRERFGPVEFRFLARGAGLDLRHGEKFKGWFNPLDPRWLQLTNVRNQHVALLEAWDQPGKHDTDAVRRQMGRQLAVETADKDRVAARHHGAAQDRAHLVEHNDQLREQADALRRGTPLTLEQKNLAAEADEMLVARRAVEPKTQEGTKPNDIWE